MVLLLTSEHAYTVNTGTEGSKVNLDLQYEKVKLGYRVLS